MAKIYNRRNRHPIHVIYVGRPSIWGNPYQIGRDGTRKEVIEKFKVFLLRSPRLLTRLPELRGKDLVCWCAPAPCHAEILMEIANAKR